MVLEKYHRIGMVHNRRTVLGLLSGGCLCCLNSNAYARERIVSCGITDAYLKELANSGSLVGVNQIALDKGFALPGLSGSGDHRFDLSLGETLSEIASTLGTLVDSRAKCNVWIEAQAD